MKIYIVLSALIKNTLVKVSKKTIKSRVLRIFKVILQALSSDGAWVPPKILILCFISLYMRGPPRAISVLEPEIAKIRPGINSGYVRAS